MPNSQDSAYPRLPSDNFFFCAAGASETSIHERAVQARPSYAYSIGTHLLVLGTRPPVPGTRLPVPGTRLLVLGARLWQGRYLYILVVPVGTDFSKFRLGALDLGLTFVRPRTNKLNLCTRGLTFFFCFFGLVLGILHLTRTLGSYIRYMYYYSHTY